MSRSGAGPDRARRASAGACHPVEQPGCERHVRSAPYVSLLDGPGVDRVAVTNQLEQPWLVEVLRRPLVQALQPGHDHRVVEQPAKALLVGDVVLDVLVKRIRRRRGLLRSWVRPRPPRDRWLSWGGLLPGLRTATRFRVPPDPGPRARGVHALNSEEPIQEVAGQPPPLPGGQQRYGPQRRARFRMESSTKLGEASRLLLWTTSGSDPRALALHGKR